MKASCSNLPLEQTICRDFINESSKEYIPKYPHLTPKISLILSNYCSKYPHILDPPVIDFWVTRSSWDAKKDIFQIMGSLRINSQKSTEITCLCKLSKYPKICTICQTDCLSRAITQPNVILLKVTKTISMNESITSTEMYQIQDCHLSKEIRN